jgi:hypothetical protein
LFGRTRHRQTCTDTGQTSLQRLKPRHQLRLSQNGSGADPKIDATNISWISGKLVALTTTLLRERDY